MKEFAILTMLAALLLLVVSADILTSSVVVTAWAAVVMSVIAIPIVMPPASAWTIGTPTAIHRARRGWRALGRRRHGTSPVPVVGMQPASIITLTAIVLLVGSGLAREGSLRRVEIGGAGVGTAPKRCVGVASVSLRPLRLWSFVNTELSWGLGHFAIVHMSMIEERQIHNLEAFAAVISVLSVPRTVA